MRSASAGRGAIAAKSFRPRSTQRKAAENAENRMSLDQRDWLKLSAALYNPYFFIKWRKER